MRKYFGTDGVRGIANTELDYNLAFKLGRAGGFVLSRNSKDRVKVVVGRDTRISGDMLESALISGLMSIGCDVICAGVCPTPAIAYLTREHKATLGVVISASHNPAEYNGIKFFDSKGYKLDDNIELEIEQYIDNPELIDSLPIGDKLGKKLHIDNNDRLYIDFLKKSVEIDLSGMKVVLDCANGASSYIAPVVFEELGAEVIAINCTPDGININNNCGSTHPQGLQERVLLENADIGLAYDGDADRLIAVDEKGCILDGDFILMLSALHMKSENKLNKNTLVVTTMSNIGLTVCAKEHDINLVATNVGDRYVLEAMKENGYNLGGEQSGHMIFSDYNSTGDGVLSSLILSKIVKLSGKSISELSSIMTKYPQVLVNARVKNENKNKYTEISEIMNEISKIEDILKDSGRVLIRPSGTEPLVRVMLEGKNRDELQAMATKLANMMEFILG